jgi:uncharacterized membrane protein
MIHMIVVGFDHASKAEEAIPLVQRMADEDLIDLNSVCVAARDQYGRASYRTISPVPGARTGAVAGSLFGALLGALLGVPFAPATAGASVLAGAAAASAVGATSGAVALGFDRSDFDEDLKSQIEEKLRPGTSALVAVVDPHRTDPDELLRRLAPLGGELVRADLAPDVAARLRRALSPAD